MINDLLSKPIESLADSELLLILEEVSSEIKKRNQLLREKRSPEKFAEELISALLSKKN